MSKQTDEHLVVTYRHLKAIRQIVTRAELNIVRPEDQSKLAEIDRYLPVIEKHIIIDLNRSLRND